MQILLVGNFLSHLGGSRGVCEDLADRLESHGWQVTRTSTHPGRLTRLADMLFTAWRARSDYQVAQVDVYSGPAFVWAEATCWLLRRLGKPYILTLHGGNLPSFAKRWPGRVTSLLGSAVVITTPSTYLQQTMFPYHKDLMLLPNPIDLSRYATQVHHHPGPNLVWLRAFHGIYNPQLAIGTLAVLLSHAPAASLLMVGPDKEDGSLEQATAEVQRLGLSERVRFKGGVPKANVPDWLKQGDIFLNTADIDNTPVTVIEAMACGLPVVSTNVGGISYMLDHDVDALLVPPNDAEAMSTAVRRILTEPGLAERLSTNGRRKVEGFDWFVILPQWKALFEEVAARG